MYKPCVVNTGEIYVENKKFEPRKKEIYKALKEIINLYLSKKINKE